MLSKVCPMPIDLKNTQENIKLNVFIPRYNDILSIFNIGINLKIFETKGNSIQPNYPLTHLFIFFFFCSTRKTITFRSRRTQTKGNKIHWVIKTHTRRLPAHVSHMLFKIYQFLQYSHKAKVFFCLFFFF